MDIPKEAKAAAGILLFGLWGPYLLYIWMVPSEVPEWAMSRGGRKALFLSRDFEPGFFTLMFAVMFISFALLGMYKLATDQLPD